MIKLITITPMTYFTDSYSRRCQSGQFAYINKYKNYYQQFYLAASTVLSNYFTTIEILYRLTF